MSTDFTSLWAMLARHIDQPAVMRALDAHFAATPVAPQATVTHELGRDAVLGRLVLSDVLDEDIAAARPDAPGFPLRLLFGELASRLHEERGFVLAAGLSYFFRAELEEDTRALLGVEVSRSFYAFELEPELRRRAAPLLAELMSGTLAHTRLEAHEDARAFDSSFMERAKDSDPSAGSPVSPQSFSLRVVASGLVKRKALVVTGRRATPARSDRR